MQISFRQGILHAPNVFLSVNGTRVNLDIPTNDYLSFTLADGNNSDYLITEKYSVPNAWIGPFNASQSYWLYWDINTVTGIKTYGQTIHEPIEGAIAPTPVMDQHWYDTANNNMMVWNGTRWVRKLRVFAAKLTANSLFTSLSINSPSFIGTQVGSLSAVGRAAGFLVYDSLNGYPITKRDGTFFTTEDKVFTGITSSSQVKYNSIVVEATATVNIPKFTMVRFTDFNSIGIATNYLVDNGVYGIVEHSALVDEQVNVVLEGIIENSEWDWTLAGINAPLYVDVYGNLTSVAPPTPIVVASVVGKHSVLLKPSTLFVDTTNDPASTSNMGSVFLSSTPDLLDTPTAVSVNDLNYLGTVAHLSDDISHITLSQHDLLSDIESNTADLYVNSIRAQQLLTDVVSLIPDTGTVDIELDTRAMLLLEEDVHINAPAIIYAGAMITLIMKQDGVGGRIITFDPVFKFDGIAPDTSTNVPDAVSVFTFISDGISLIEVSRTNNIV